jgi:hypothetical protein
MLARANAFLDKYVLPWPVRFLTFRFVILATIAMLIPLIVYADNTVMVLGLNSYLNVMSVAVSSIVLLYATVAEVRQQKLADMQEQRAQEDHAHVTEMHAALLEALTNQHEEIEDLKQIIADMRGQQVTRRARLPKPNLHALHPRGQARFADADTEQRLSAAGLQKPTIGAGADPDKTT